MKKLLNVLTALLCITMLVSLAGCAGQNAAASSAPPTAAASVQASSTAETPVTLTISAAASLKESFEEVKKLYNADKPNVTLKINYGSSGTLQQQIEQGAPVDLFLSAAAKQMDALSKKSLLLEDTRVNLLGNSVVLVVKSDSSLAISDFKDSTSDKIKKLALGEPKTVPAGQYAEEIYTKLNILDKVKTKAVYGKDVKEVLTWVETGNADAGVVYGSDAKASTKVKVVATAAKDLMKTPVVYPAAVIKASKYADAAKEFLKYLSDSKSKAIFEKYGFDFLIK